MLHKTGETRSTSEWQELDRRHYLHPFTNHKSLGKRGTRVITRAEGVYLWDADNKRYLDAMAGLWCVNVGYGRKELIEAARVQLEQLPYYNSFFQTAHPPVIELSALLGEITQPQFNHVFFAGSGSESNDTVVRMVRRYWQLKEQPDRHVIISRENAYHGSTIAATTLGGMKPMHDQGGPWLPGIEHIGQPYWYGLGGDRSPDEFGLDAARLLEKKIGELGAGNIAAFIAEPVQGAGGVVIPPDSYWPEIQRICNEHDILLVADEVITGFGRLGAWFGSDHYDIRPDLMSIAKGLSSGYMPIGGVMVSDRVADTLIEEGGEFHHGFTYSGHPVACAVAAANIRLLRDEKIVEKVRDETGPYLASRWQELNEHPLVGEARTVGFLAAAELVGDKTTRARFEPKGKAGEVCRDYCFDNGLVMRAVGDTLVASPPLVFEKEHIDELIECARKCLDLTAAHMASGE